MSAYMILRIEIDESARLDDYRVAAAPAIAKYHGKFIVRGGSVVSLEGPEESRRIVVIEFPTLAGAKACYNSPEYQKALKLREGIGHFEVITVDGVEC